MEWLNENCGLIALISAVIIVILVGLTIWLLNRLLNKIAVQKLNFLGHYSVESDTKRRYAHLTIGNKSLNDVGIDELGLQNGKVNFPLTDKYKRDKEMPQGARIVIEQRNSIDFQLSCEELRAVVLENNGKQVLKTLRVYAVDLTGTIYRGRIPAVRKLLKEMLTAEKLAAKAAAGATSAPDAASESAETEDNG